jgi:hypothetical protein
VMESLLAIHRLNPGEMKGILTEKDARGGAFKDFLQRHVSHPEFQSDARMLLSAYYS